MFFTQVCIWLYSGIISTGVFPLEEEILLCPVWKLERAGWCFWGCVEKRVGWDWLMAVFLNPDLALPSWMSLTTNQVFQPWGQAGGQRKAGTLTALSSSLGLCPQPGISTGHAPHWSLAPSFLFLPFTCIKSLCWSWVSLYRMGKGLCVLLWWRCFHSCTEWQSLPKCCPKGTQPAVSWGLSRWSRPVLWLFLKGFWKQPYFARLGWEG